MADVTRTMVSSCVLVMTWEIMEERDSDAEPDLWRQRESAAIADTTCKDNKRFSLVYDI